MGFTRVNILKISKLTQELYTKHCFYQFFRDFPLRQCFYQLYLYVIYLNPRCFYTVYNCARINRIELGLNHNSREKYIFLNSNSVQERNQKL